MPLTNPKYLTLVGPKLIQVLTLNQITKWSDHSPPLPRDFPHNLRHCCLPWSLWPGLALHIWHRWALRSQGLHGSDRLYMETCRDNSSWELYIWSTSQYRSFTGMSHFLHEVQTGILVVITFIMKYISHPSGCWVLQSPPRETKTKKAEHNLSLAGLPGSSRSEVRKFSWLQISNYHFSSVVGNFQETQVAVVHFIGASMAFGLGTIYLWMQASVEITNPCPGKRGGGTEGKLFVLQVYFSFLMEPPSCPRLVSWGRVLLALLDSLSLVTTVLAGFIAMLVLEWHGWVTSHLVFIFFTVLFKARTQILIIGVKVKRKYNFNKLKYLQTENPGWALHIASTASEWIMFISFDIFLLTFWPDFSSLSLNIKCDNKHEIINQLWHKSISSLYYLSASSPELSVVTSRRSLCWKWLM